MDSITKIKLVLLAIIFILVNSITEPLLANSYIIELKESDTLSRNTSDIISAIMPLSKVKWGDIITIDSEKLIDTDTLLCFFDNNEEVLFVKNRVSNLNHTYIHFESLDNNIQAYVSVFEGNISIDLITTLDRYVITSISKFKAAIIRYESDIQEDPIDNLEMHTDSDNIESIIPFSTPVIRVLFLYTYSALNMMSYYQPNETMKNVIYTYITKANESFQNSNINAWLELAYIGYVNYVEENFTWSEVLDHFYGSSDGYLEDVHSLRNKYAADICVLVLNKDDWCGEAKTIKANANSAFCLVYPAGECNSKYTVVHEIGHLIGCRHNYSADINLVPYAYGHGYYHYEEDYPFSSWRTMMAYDNSCTTGCQRILYWSNPDVNYNGIPTGTSSLANNALVWNNRASTVGAFRTNSSDLFLTLEDNNFFSLFESYFATNTITIGTGYEIQAGQTVDMAATQIRLTPNTHIKYGSLFRASIRNNAEDATYPQFAPSERNALIDIKSDEKKSDVSLSINDFLVQNDNTIKEIEIYNLQGQCLIKTNNVKISQFEIPAGVYIVKTQTIEGQIFQQKIVQK